MEPPVPIEAIAEAQGALILRNHFPGYESGFALREGGRWVIGVNTATSPRRQRFTIAHELGHLLLHDDPLITDYSVLVGMRDENSSLGTHRQEVEANGFAAAILMPQDLIFVELKRELEVGADSRDELIARLARTFDVSTEAMGYRLVNLSIITA
ncbi:ImmA/IrrE family metallo-endopeptidase [Longispora sp. NPDC051575]|uniref:ImmA/IrrE family metallo-endopeptidase n=1 Tax=Longispora sp. NPDC051575 TaxID=3154943 RepID=UPI00341560D0